MGKLSPASDAAWHHRATLPQLYLVLAWWCGFWPLRHPSDYRNEGLSVEFIEKATREALARVR